MNDFTLPGATILAQVPERRFTALDRMPVDTLLDMFTETLDEIRLVATREFPAASRKNGHSAINKTLSRMGIDPVREVMERSSRKRAAYLDAGMYGIETRRRVMGVE